MKDITNNQLDINSVVLALREIDKQICSGGVDFKGAEVTTSQLYEPDYSCTLYNHAPSVRKTRRDVEITIRVSYER